MTASFDTVDVERLRRRRTVKWTLYGPDVLAAWVAEMDFDVAPVVRAAILCSALGLDDPARFFLDHAKVAVSDGPPFGSGCEQFVRLNFATSRALLEQIVGAIGAALAHVGSP